MFGILLFFPCASVGFWAHLQVCWGHCAFSIHANIKTLNIWGRSVAFVAKMTFAEVYTNTEAGKQNNKMKIATLQCKILAWMSIPLLRCIICVARLLMFKFAISWIFLEHICLAKMINKSICNHFAEFPCGKFQIFILSILLFAPLCGIIPY